MCKEKKAPQRLRAWRLLMRRQRLLRLRQSLSFISSPPFRVTTPALPFGQRSLTLLGSHSERAAFAGLHGLLPTGKAAKPRGNEKAGSVCPCPGP
jgi:hypothetical protein